MGNLQQNYQNFQQSILNYKRYKALSFYDKKIEKLQKQIFLTNLHLNSLKRQEILQRENLDLTKKQFKRDSLLYTENVITTLEYEKSQIQLLNSKTTFENSAIALSNSQIQINQLEQQIVELQLTNEKETKQLTDDVNNNRQSLLSAISEWELAFVLKSSAAGVVSLGNYWSENQSVKVGDVVMSVIPNNVREPFGKVMLSMENSGKVKIGQKVNIKLLNFPYAEFGIIKGTVKTISVAPEQGNYYIEVALENGLQTNYNKQLPFLQEMSGTAEIITEDMRLAERILAPAKSLFKEKVDL